MRITIQKLFQWGKNYEEYEYDFRKSENDDFRHIFGSIGQNFFSENGFRTFLATLKRIYVQNIAKKVMIKSRESVKKTAYRPEKFLFRKLGSVTFWVLPFYIIVQNQKIIKILSSITFLPFYNGFRLFRRFLRSSGFKGWFFWKPNDAKFRASS